MLNYKELLEAILPDGPFWDPADDEGLDQLLEGMATGEVTVMDFLHALAYVRDPYRTPILVSLEREYGLVPNAAISEEDRRKYLAAIKYSRTGTGDRDFMQEKLVQAGFNVFVYQNDPPVNPSHFLFGHGAYLMFAGDTLSQAGEPLAQAGGFVGELLVNGDLYESYVDYLVGAGDVGVQAGETDAMAGNFSGTIRRPIEYECPCDPDYWPLIFFVGGFATFAPDSGAEMFAGDTLSQAGEPLAQAGFFEGQITDIEFADIPNERREQFRRLILKIKPLHSWAALVVNYN